MKQLKTVLVADISIHTCQFLKIRLSYLGYSVIIVTSGQDVLSAFKKKNPDLIILDMMLEQTDGYKICTTIRQVSRVPIIILTALTNITDRIRGLDLGVDKYLTKPFFPGEVESCVRSLIIPPYERNYFNPHVIQIGDLKLDTIKKNVFEGSNLVNLTLIEFNLLKLFMRKAGKSLTRTAILNYIWGCTSYRFIDTRVVDVYVSRLRSKLKQGSRISTIILTVRGEGYMFQSVEN
jgi:OmpR family response regulator RpaB